MVCRVLLLFLAGLLASAIASRATEHYSTDFSSFDVGADTWANAEGWQSTSTNEAVQGILLDALPGLGNSAYLGANPTTNLSVSVSRDFNLDPIALSETLVDFETTLGIADSTNSFRDSFFISIKNQAGFRLGSIRFSNEPTSFGIWREDGAQQHDTGIDLPIDTLFLFSFRIDYLSNTWSAFVSGSPIFINQPFNQTGEILDLGSLSFDWQIASTNAAESGDNFLIVDELTISSTAVVQPPFPVQSMGLSSENAPQISWTAEPGYNYQLQYSNDYSLWRSDLPGSFFGGFIFNAPITYTDHSATNAQFRVYRINRASE